MSKWAKLARQGRSSTRVIPVNVASTPEYAETLECRLKVLHETIVPAFQSREANRA
jgi:hypothetical protein